MEKALEKAKDRDGPTEKTTEKDKYKALARSVKCTLNNETLMGQYRRNFNRNFMFKKGQYPVLKT